MTWPTWALVALAAAAVVLWPGPVRTLGRVAGRTATTGAAGQPSGTRRSEAARDRAETALAELLALVAAPLRAGVSPLTSLEAAAGAVEDDPVVGELTRRLVAAGLVGEDVPKVWAAHDQGGDAALLVARAWALSERTGAPLADALGAAEQVLRARRRTRQRLTAAAAGPRASMKVLTLLPLSGPVVGLACGIGPRELYLQSPLALASLALGLVLALAAWTWSRAILGKAAA